MLRQLPLAAFLCCASACFPASAPHHHHRDRDAEAVGAIVAAGYVVATAVVEEANREERASTYQGPMPMCAEFDRELARKALATTMYKDCGHGGVGHLIVTFDTDGSVSSARLEDGDYTENTEACIAGRFESVRVAPFCGSYHRVRWQIELPD